MSNKLRVLIVDDEPAVLTTLKLAMRKQPWEVVTAESGEAALELYEPHAFDVALIDKNLPGMSGVDLIREIRQTDVALGILMITGYASVGSAVETLSLNIDAYIEKPFDNVFDVVDRVEATAAQRKKLHSSGNLAKASSHFRKATEALLESSQESNGAESLAVLVVCPDEGDREWIAKQFRTGNACVVQAPDASDALAAAREVRQDLAIIDAAIGESELLSLLAGLRDLAPSTGLLVLAERRPDLGVITRLIDLGVRAILDKPLDAKKFRAQLEIISRKHQADTVPEALKSVVP